MTSSEPEARPINLEQDHESYEPDERTTPIDLDGVSIDIDRVLTQLWQLSDEKPGKKANLTENQLNGIAKTARDIFLKEDVLLELKAPINVCGDIHGQYYDLLRVFSYGGAPPTSTYLFLGDYVDRGEYSIETICLLFCLKIKYPDKIYLLRGNHETESISKIYGFYNQCKKRYNIKIWKSFIASFANLPVAAIIEDRIICMHGGLSPSMLQPAQIRQIQRPTEVPEQGLICDLLWADPTVQTGGWAESERGCSYVFGQEVTSYFLRANNLDLICRAHQVVEDGYEFCHKKRVVTLFSAPNYCNQFDNAGAFMKIDSNLRCSFHILKPADKTKGFKNSKPKTQYINMD